MEDPACNRGDVFPVRKIIQWIQRIRVQIIKGDVSILYCTVIDKSEYGPLSHIGINNIFPRSRIARVGPVDVFVSLFSLRIRFPDSAFRINREDLRTPAIDDFRESESLRVLLVRICRATECEKRPSEAPQPFPAYTFLSETFSSSFPPMKTTVFPIQNRN